MPLVLSVFANTGHQFFTRPLAELLGGKEADLIRLVQQGSRQFMPWSASHPWLRYRLWTDAENKNRPVITIAVESNLGPWSRGTLYHTEPCEPEPDLPLFFPYAEERLANPNDGIIEKVTSFSVGDSSYDVDLRIHFKGSAAEHPVKVDLIVDLGNTRTAAVLLEAPPEGKRVSLSERIGVLKINPRGVELTPASPRQGLPKSLIWAASEQSDLAIIDSWFLLHETLFAHLEPGRGEAQPEGVIRQANEHEFASGSRGWLQEYLLPHAFTELSPALIGGGKSKQGVTTVFANANLGQGYPFFLSSPKRYVWSTAGRGTVEGTQFWFQVPNQPDPETGQPFIRLRGLFRYLMAPGGADLHTDRATLGIQPTEAAGLMPFKQQAPPAYSNSDTVCWFALALLEAAHRQMNSEAYLAGRHNEQTPRRLRSVRVTYPTGWTFEERDLYFRQWQRAINIYTMTRFEPEHWGLTSDGGSRPELGGQNLDEAVSSQLPILYSQVQAMAGQADKWIELHGDSDGAVVMNLDIGGGTTDVAIIKYKSGGQIRNQLRPQLLFRDGWPVAGDLVVKKIVEGFLIPEWFRASKPGGSSPQELAAAELEVLFRKPRDKRVTEIGGAASSASRRLARVVRLLFIPVVNLLLKGLSRRPQSEGGAARPAGAENKQTINIRDCIEARIIPKEALAELNHLCVEIILHHFPNERNRLDMANNKVFGDDVTLTFANDALERCVDEVFAPLFGALGALVGRHNCHLLIVSGKPSELSRVHELVTETFPLLPQRIIRVKDYPAGDWYPSEFATADKEGRITDAKTCTVVGAALYQDHTQNRVPGFSILMDPSATFVRNAYWGLLPEAGAPGQFFNRNKLLFAPSDYPPDLGAGGAVDELEKLSAPMRLNLAVPQWIGRQVVRDPLVKPSPVYRLIWSPPVPPRQPLANAQVVFRWRSLKGKGDKLELASVTALPGEPEVNPADVRLELNTLNEEDGEFWLDNPRLEVTLPKLSAKP